MPDTEGEAEEAGDERRSRRPSRRELEMWWRQVRGLTLWTGELLGLSLQWDDRTVAFVAVATKATVWIVDRFLRR